MLRTAVFSMILMFAANAMAAGDPEAGQAKAGVCAACHGMDGNGNPQITEWPKIAGQHQDYLARQTRMVRDQQRVVAQMYPIVMNLSDEDIADISAWYASQALKPGTADEAQVEAGRQLYHGGNPDSGVPSCMACHGPAGNGIPGAGYPLVRGQYAEYSADRLRRYRSGEVNGEDDPYSRIMAGVAANLTDEEIDAVSSYIEGLYSSDD